MIPLEFLEPCPRWCEVEALYADPLGVLHPEVVHTRALESTGPLSARLEWIQDLTPLEDPDHFRERPVLALHHDERDAADPLRVPVTAGLADALEQIARALRAWTENED